MEAKRLGGETTWGRNDWGRNDLTWGRNNLGAKQLGGETTWGRNDLGAKRLGGETTGYCACGSLRLPQRGQTFHYGGDLTFFKQHKVNYHGSNIKV